MAKKTESSRHGQVLTVGFHNANPPLIWRLDLERNHSFSMTLQAADGDWDLGMTSPGGTFTPVAHFTAREDAEDAFEEVEATLSTAPPGLVVKAIKMLLLLCVVLIAAGVCISIYRMATTPAPVAAAPALAATPMTPAAPTAPVAPPGQAVSADEVLQAPAEADTPAK